MSSSSSLSAAKRRRGQNTNGPPPPQTTRNANNNAPAPTQLPIMPPNPMEILKQHHIMLGDLNDKITEIMSHDSPLSNENNNELTQQFNTDEVATLLLGKIEEQMDLKALYDNDNNLATEIDKLHQIINNQQLVLNDMNRVLYFIIESLNLEKPDLSISDKKENVTKIVVDNSEPTFPNKSVEINTDLNEIKEFDNDDEGLEIGSVE
ncbi:hypothetical protein N8996_05190 [Candidatus Poseidonia alphae]|nr:hypothetical protein [Candidatus Poseidonia alphae]